MSDYYLEFSQVLSHLDDEESDWLRQQLEIVHVFGTQEFPVSKMPPDLDPAYANWSGYRFYREYDEEVFDTEEAGFCFQFMDREDREHGCQLWVYSQDNGELDPLAHLVQRFLSRFRPDQSWSMTYATTCSKPYVDSFGGGAVFVTAGEIKFSNAWDFIEHEEAAFRGSHPASTG